MEIPKFKKISKYDEYTINEFVRELVKTRSEVDKEVIELDSKIEEVKSKDTKVMTEEEKAEHKSNLTELRSQKRKVQNYLKKYEAEKERIKTKLESKKEENENKIRENEEEIHELEEQLRENEQKMETLDQDSEEYANLIKSNNDINKKISRTRGSITRFDKKINNIIEIIGNLETENVLEGLKPPKTITKAKTLTLDEKYKLHIEKKARETGYYTNARTEEQSKNFRSMDELAIRLKQENEAELLKNTRLEATPEKPQATTPIPEPAPEKSQATTQNQTLTPEQAKKLTQEQLLQILRARQEQMTQQTQSVTNDTTNINQTGTAQKTKNTVEQNLEEVVSELQETVETKTGQIKDVKELSFLKSLLEKIKKLLDTIIKKIENLDKKTLTSGEPEKTTPTLTEEKLNLKDTQDRAKFRESLLYRGYLKGKNAGSREYYAPGSVRSAEQNSNFKKMDELAKQLKLQNDAELKAKVEEERSE